MKAPMKFPGKYTIDLKGRTMLGNIPELILHDRLRDGRIMGLLAEDILPYEFSGLTRVPGNGASHDLIKSDVSPAVRVQCKSFNSDKTSQVDLAPSYMKGQGRKFNFEGFMVYAESFEVWAFIDVARFPVLTVYALPCKQVVDNATVTQSAAKLSIQNLTRSMKGQPQ